MPDRRDKPRRPKAKNAPKQKIVRQASMGEADPLAARALPPHWRLGRMDFAGGWSWAALDPVHVADLHSELVAFESEPIRVLRRNKRMKDISVESMCPEAQQRLKTLEQEDIDVLTELRLKAGQRAWGILESPYFHMVWWDPDHTVCRGKDRARTRSKEGKR